MFFAKKIEIVISMLFMELYCMRFPTDVMNIREKMQMEKRVATSSVKVATS